ncbi:1-aminocyclopropane-1-carboxylate oxidase-like [Solanum tuberosum]|nr:PREDICTED: 1-aminocyclopropane-1-carboxylate oxidase-like [Solanum tuberosum]
MASFDIPTIEVSPFFRLEENIEEGKKKVIVQIREACVNYENLQECSLFDILRQVLEAIVSHFTKLEVVLEGIINECLGLPPDFLPNYRNDRSRDSLLGLHYFPAIEDDDNTAKTAHEDPGCFTILYQDEVRGLEVHKDDQWIPIAPSKDKLIVNIGDVIQVLSNNKFKSTTHRVVRPSETNRYSYSFFYNVHGDKWVEPLPQFTKEIGESPKYRGFLFEEYHQLRFRNRSHPSARPEDLIHITHYSISN